MFVRMIYAPKLRKNEVTGYFIVLKARSAEGHLLFIRLWNLRPEQTAVVMQCDHSAASNRPFSYLLLQLRTQL